MPQVYGFGKSEELIADFSRTSSKQPVVATKFAPLPYACPVSRPVSLGTTICEVADMHSWP